MRTDSTKSHWRIALGASASLVVIAVASLVWIRSRPAFSEEELAGATRALDDLRAEFDDAECHRPPVADGPAAPEGSLAALLDPDGAFGSCFEAARQDDVIDARRGIVRGPDGEDRRWVFDMPESDTDFPAPVPGRSSVLAGHPLYPAGEGPPAYLRVQAACAGLAEAVAELAAGRGECSPYPPSRWGGYGPNADTQLPAFAEALSILARRDARDGDLEGALALLVQGTAVAQDARRGHSGLAIALQSVGAEAVLRVTFNSLLISSPAPSPAARQTLVELLDRVIEGGPHPHGAFAGDALALWAEASGATTRLERTSLQMIAAGHARGVAESCPRDRDPADCLSGIAPPDTSEPSLMHRAWQVIGGPEREARAGLSSIVAHDLNGDRHAYVPILSESPVGLELMKVVLALSAERQRGVCPLEAVLDDHLLGAPARFGSPDIRRLAGAEYEVSAPLWADEAVLKSIAFPVVCPAVGGRWFPVDAN